MKCPVCDNDLRKYGFTSTGKQRYQCPNCGFVKVLQNPAVDPNVERLEAHIRRLEKRVEYLEYKEAGKLLK